MMRIGNGLDSGLLKVLKVPFVEKQLSQFKLKVFKDFARSSKLVLNY